MNTIPNAQTLDTLWELIAELADVLRAAPINHYPDCWEIQIDARWYLAVNAHSRPRRCSRGYHVNPYCCYIEWLGWPAGEISPQSGILPAGLIANSDTLLDALRARLARERATASPLPNVN